MKLLIRVAGKRAFEPQPFWGIRLRKASIKKNITNLGLLKWGLMGSEEFQMPNPFIWFSKKPSLFWCPTLTKLALDLHVNFRMSMCVSVCILYFRSLFQGFWLGVLFTSGRGSGNPLIQLGLLSWAEHCYTQVYEDDLKNEDDFKNEDNFKN